MTATELAQLEERDPVAAAVLRLEEAVYYHRDKARIRLWDVETLLNAYREAKAEGCPLIK